MQSVPITTNVVSLNPTCGMVYSIQHYMIKFVTNLRQVWFTPVSPTNKIDRHDITEILLKVTLKHHNPNSIYFFKLPFFIPTVKQTLRILSTISFNKQCIQKVIINGSHLNLLLQISQPLLLRARKHDEERKNIK